MPWAGSVNVKSRVYVGTVHLNCLVFRIDPMHLVQVYKAPIVEFQLQEEVPAEALHKMINQLFPDSRRYLGERNDSGW